MRTLTPVLLLPAPEQVSLVHHHALPDIPSPTTPCASVPAMLPAPVRLGPRFALGAIGGSSDFAHYSQSRQSHMAVSSLCRRARLRSSSTDYLFTSSCSPRRVAGTQLLSVVRREAPPERDFHPPVRTGSQAHERGHSCPQRREKSPATLLFLERSSNRTLLRTGMSALRSTFATGSS